MRRRRQVWACGAARRTCRPRGSNLHSSVLALGLKPCLGFNSGSRLNAGGETAEAAVSLWADPGVGSAVQTKLRARCDNLEDPWGVNVLKIGLVSA